MKVILLETVKKIGKQYEVKDVTSGFARNFLIPQKKAIPATEKNITQFEKKKVEQESKKGLQEDLLIKSLSGLSNTKIKITAPANDEGHLYAQIDSADIINALKEQTHIVLEKEHIALEKPLKEVGDFKIEVLVGGKKGEFQLEIEKEDVK